MRVVVLGSGTSAGVPTLGCRCDVCRSPNPRNKRMRASLYLETEAGLRALVDCGPDFRTQALANGIEDVDVVLLTHAHADHVGGLDDLRSFNMVHKHPITVFGAEDTLADVRRRFAYAFEPPQQVGGGLPDLRLEPIDVGKGLTFADASDGEVALRAIPIPIFHGRLPILGYRFGDFAYLTDVSKVPDSSMELLVGVRLLITTALRHKPHPTHMSLGEAIEFSRAIGAERTWFTHMCHDLEHEATNAALPEGMALSYDGLVFEA